MGSDGEDFHLECEGAGCSLWWNGVPSLDGERVGVIGHFSSNSAGGTARVLELAAGTLRERGCTIAVGPMDGNTWRKYRFVTEAGTEPPFFLEITNPPEWVEQWRAAGFDEIAGYSSVLNRDLSTEDPKVGGVERRLAGNGTRVRQIRPERFEEELAGVFDVSVVAFRNAYLYTPIGREQFVGQYSKIKSIVDPRLVLIAEQGGRVVGYMFGVPDVLEATRIGKADTVILKTLAILPDRSHAGLGSYLIARCQDAAREMGMTRSIFAFMHDSNHSKNIAARYGRPMRRYGLFARKLT